VEVGVLLLLLGSGTSSIATSITNNAVENIMLRQSSGLSLIGRGTNSTGNVADITAATANHVFRTNSAGTAIGWGAVNLASSDAVTGQLGVAFGGTGIASGTSGGILYFSASGTIGSSGALTAGTIVKGGGAGGAPATTGITIDSNDQMYGQKVNFNDQVGTSYGVIATDTGKTITLTNAASIAVSIPNTLAIGWTVEVIQGGDGEVAFGGAATIQNRSSHTKIAGKYGAVRLVVVANSGGSSAIVNLAGDTKA
jgi:hypothetical protein